MESIEKSEEFTFRYRIRKYRRISIPKTFPEVEEGDLVDITVKKLKNNHIKKDYPENNKDNENQKEN